MIADFFEGDFQSERAGSSVPHLFATVKQLATRAEHIIDFHGVIFLHDIERLYTEYTAWIVHLMQSRR